MSRRRPTYRPPPRPPAPTTQQRLDAAALRVGDRVTVDGFPLVAFTVIGTDDRALVELEAPTGARLKAGRLRVRKISDGDDGKAKI